ncbi:hypothetical protein CNR33_00007 [Pseudomonas phage tabernarius]|uniref:Uncharacterized protein n=1 Tax=Pseudomonas phage tabernarius TaxID=2048978 RepID=A0A2H4P6M3_9CAUD|nr:hypothetical protein FDJ17_gp07 [Pseudomonas phage tabernarius]ATW57853.1 hypothetical protein CNR33_00007 [Pseudomonas phage tabernarius]
MDHLLSVKPLDDNTVESTIARATVGNTAFIQTEVGELVVAYRKSNFLCEGARIATVAYAAMPHALLGAAIVDDLDTFTLDEKAKVCPFDSASEFFKAGWKAFHDNVPVTDNPFGICVDSHPPRGWKSGWVAAKNRTPAEVKAVPMLPGDTNEARH